jgi:1-hydroxycarotenoid 3,4-desaturase
VKEIRLERGVVEGVLLEDDTFVAADAVVYNGDISAIGTGLLGEEVRRAASPTPLRRRSLSALVGALVTETSGFPLSSHNVFFHTAPYKKEFTDIFKKGRLPTHPTVYVRAQDRDRCQRQGDQGPQKGGEKERIFFIINAPPSGDVSPLANEEIELCLHSAQALLHRSGLSVDLDQENRRIYSPTEFAKRFPGTGGALYGAATHAMTAAIKRRGVRSKVSGLYFAGGSVHPGAGVPMAALGGRQAANALLSDFGLTKLSPLTDMPGGTSTG